MPTIIKGKVATRQQASDIFGLMRNKFLSISERVESRLVGETDKDKFKKVLLDDIPQQ